MEKYNINPEYKHLFSFKNEQEELHHEAQMAIYQFISVIEQCLEIKGISRKELAHKINVHPATLTKIWRGNMPLSFKILAKIQKALNIQFEITAKEEPLQIDGAFEDLVKELITPKKEGE